MHARVGNGEGGELGAMQELALTHLERVQEDEFVDARGDTEVESTEE